MRAVDPRVIVVVVASTQPVVALVVPRLTYTADWSISCAVSVSVLLDQAPADAI